MRIFLSFLALLTAALATDFAHADGVPVGPPPGATLSVAKLAPIIGMTMDT